MNGDGRLDLIVGDRNGYVNYYTRNADGSLHAQPQMIANGSTVLANYNSSPVIVDWNNDGLLDLVLGSQGDYYAGGDPLRLYLNSGTANSYLFTTYSSIYCADTNILQYRCMPTVADLNSDGRKDLLIGNDSAYMYYYENDGTDAAPHFSTAVQVQTVSGPIHEYYGLRQCVNNWNEGGPPDLITSDYNGNVRVYLACPTGIEQGQGPIPQAGGFSVVGSPTSGSFTAELALDAPAAVRISVFSEDGRLISRTALGDMASGSHDLPFDLSGNPPGVYVLLCTAGQNSMTARVVLTR